MVKKHFKVSSALKDIIGKDLISDDFVAIFELVKNSFDANSKRVDVTFKDLSSVDGKIIIKDNGKGMDLDDFEKKWLFVAYSAKKDGTEDYRDEIRSKRIHAGAKGIGRFSCDRLGNSLTIFSKRSDAKSVSKLTVNWEDFERNINDKFEKISVNYELIENCPYEIKTGTILEISGVRSEWDEDKLIKLRRSLEKLVNPAQSNVQTQFSIYLNANDFKVHDKEKKLDGKEHLLINGKVKNFLFEKLDLKTTRIEVSIDPDGETITSELYDRGTFIYRILEENPFIFSDWRLENIKVHLFSLNKASKTMFTQYMGVRAVQFGSVFVYKNGFRIHPIGEIGHGDVFGLDARKQQGTSRFFGTRDLIGRIEIDGDNEEFKEASSRDGGLIRNFAFKTLTDFFINNALKRLEKFAVDVVKFGNIDADEPGTDIPKEKALSFIESLTKSETIHDIEFNSDIFDVVSNASQKSLGSLLNNLGRIALDGGSSNLLSEVSKIEKKISEFSKATKAAEDEVKRETQKRREAEKLAREEALKVKKAEEAIKKERSKTKQVTKQTMFLRSMVSSDLQNVVALHHHIGIAAGTIENYVRGVSKKIRAGKPMTAESFLSVLDEISFVARQISATTKFATKANFNMEAELIEDDLNSYIEQYIMNVCSGLMKVDGDLSKDVSFAWEAESSKDFKIRFRPLEVSMVIDSLINNSIKAGADKVKVFSRHTGEDLIVSFSDNGKGIKNSNHEKIFEMGFTTTNGSGLGLHHARNIMRDMHGEIYLDDTANSGAKFILRFTR